MNFQRIDDAFKGDGIMTVTGTESVVAAICGSDVFFLPFQIQTTLVLGCLYRAQEEQATGYLCFKRDLMQTNGVAA